MLQPVSSSAVRPIGLLSLCAAVVLAAGCGVDKNSMVAPTNSVVNVGAATPLVVAGSATPLTINLAGADGAPVPDGTEVWITASRGELDQQKTRTRNGAATVTFRAPSESGPVQVVASSADVRGALDLAITSAPVARIALSANPAVLPPAGGETDVVATVHGPDGQLVAGAPVKFKVNSGTVTPDTATSDANGVARARLKASADTTVNASILNLHAADLPVRLQPRFELIAEPAVAPVRSPITFRATLSSGGSGTVSLQLGNGQTRDLGRITGPGSVSLSYAFPAPGGFNATAVFQPSGGEAIRATVRVQIEGAGGAPPPAGGGGGGPADPNVPFSLSDVTWLHTNVSNWAVTSTVTGVSIGDPPVCISHTKSGRWPVKNGVEGNPWVFANINGRWYAATYEWLRPGQTCKGVSARDIGAHTKQSPMTSWRPRSGELVGFMVSAHARFGRESVAERSNVVMVRWP